MMDKLIFWRFCMTDEEAGTRMSKGTAYMKAGNFDRAMDELDEVADKAFNKSIRAQANVGCGVVRFNQGSYLLAIRYFEKALADDPYVPNAREFIEKARQAL
jgi:tetratricopeptide (TPR) repeat protein